MRSAYCEIALLPLSFLGLICASVPAMAIHSGYMLPCGLNASCNTLLYDPRSSLFGVPFAYYGIVYYLLLTIVTFALWFAPKIDNSKLKLTGLFLSGAGVAISFILQYVAIVVVKATCVYCLTSTCVSIVIFLMFAWLWDTAAIKTSELLIGKKKMIAFVVCVVSTSLVIMYSYRSMGHENDEVKLKFDSVKSDDIVSEIPNKLGSENAVVKIVEFGDLFCPQCRQASVFVSSFARTEPKKIMFVYRSFVLPQHKHSRLAAAIADIGGESGLFWTYLEMVSTSELVDDTAEPEKLYELASKAGINVNRIRSRLLNPDDIAFKRIDNDTLFAKKLGVSFTPTFVLLVRDRPPKALTADSMMSMIKSGQLRKLYLDGR